MFKFTPPEKFDCNIIKLNIPIRQIHISLKHQQRTRYTVDVYLPRSGCTIVFIPLIFSPSTALSTAAAVCSTTSRGSIDGPALKLYFFIYIGKFYKLRKNKFLSDRFGSGCFWSYFVILFVFIQLCRQLHAIINTNNLFKITHKIITA